MRPVLLFCVLSCGVSWAFAIRLEGLGGFTSWPGLAGAVLVMLYMGGPLVATVLTEVWLKTERVRAPRSMTRPPLRQSLLWCLAGWALAAGLAALVFAAQSMLDFGASPAWLNGSGASEDPQTRGVTSIGGVVDPMTGLALVAAALVAGTLCFYVTEEQAWRGWLHSRLRHWNTWTSSLLIGLLWAVWMLPLSLLASGEGSPIPCASLLVVWALASAPYLGFFANRGGVLAASGLRSGLTVFALVGVLAHPAPVTLASSLASATGVAILLSGWPVLAMLMRRDASTILNPCSAE